MLTTRINSATDFKPTCLKTFFPIKKTTMTHAS